MVQMRIVEKPAFQVAGRSTWISGQDNEQFGAFWAQCRETGLLDKLSTLTGGNPGKVTRGMVVGVSRVEADPQNRAFHFLVCVEVDGDVPCDLEAYTVPGCTWAVFANSGAMPMALVDAEMEAFMHWLPASGYRHAAAPEMEVYPPGESADGGMLCEFWLPVERA